MIYKFNNTAVDSESFILCSDGSEIPVEPKVFNLIVYLIEHADKVVSRDELLDQVWQGTVVSDTSINNSIKSARKVLGDDGTKQHIIKTIHGRGYKFIAEIETVQPTHTNKNNSDNTTQSLFKHKYTLAFIGIFTVGLLLSVNHYSNNSEHNNREVSSAVGAKKSIAVLAFKDMSPESNQEYFSDGISEELLNLFTQIPDLRVASRTSSFSFKNKDNTIEEIGDQLNVSHVLEGSVRKSGDKIRITVQLIQVDNGAHIWSETYDHDFTDIFDIQDKIALAVSEQLKIKLLNPEPHNRSINQEAYTYYLQAIYLLKENTEESISKALNLIGQSIAIETDYAPSWTVYSRILYTVVIYSYKKQTPGVFLLAKQAALKAIEIDDSYAKAYAQLALINLLDWDTQAAQKNIDTAMSLNSNDSSIIGVAAYNLQLNGQLAACATMLENAINLDPLNDVHYLNLGIVYLLLDRTDEAYQAVTKYAYFHPDAVAQHAMMSHVLMAMGRYEEALAEANLEVNEYWKLSTLSFATYAIGDTKRADQLLTEYVLQYGESIPGHIASLYAYRGENDNAFKWLETAYKKHDSGLLHVINFQTLRNLWNDSRWDDFIEKLNLPEGHWLVEKRING